MTSETARKATCGPPDLPASVVGAESSCSSCSGDAISLTDAAPNRLSVASAASQTFRIALMDCANEEYEIRRALEALPGIRSLAFQLGARTLTIDADASAMDAALAAIRKAGFSPLPLSAPRSRDVGAECHDYGHDHAGHDPHGTESGTSATTPLTTLMVRSQAGGANPRATRWRLRWRSAQKVCPFSRRIPPFGASLEWRWPPRLLRLQVCRLTAKAWQRCVTDASISTR